jgi:hypothetical protein
MAHGIGAKQFPQNMQKTEKWRTEKYLPALRCSLFQVAIALFFCHSFFCLCFCSSQLNIVKLELSQIDSPLFP